MPKYLQMFYNFTLYFCNFKKELQAVQKICTFATEKIHLPYG